MQKSIKLSTDQCRDRALLKEVADAGFEGIDIGYSKDFLNDDVYEKNACAVLEELEKAGLKCSQVHLPYYGIFKSSEIYEEDTDKRIRNALHTMKILGASWGAYHPMTSFNYDCDTERAIHDNKEKLKKYLETAVKYDVGIAVENIPIFPDCPQYKFFSANPEEHCRLVDELNDEHIGVCWDFGHANLMEYDHEKVLDYVGDRIKIVHMHNNVGSCDLHIAPLIGTINWKTLLPVLTRHNYSGALSLELNMSLVDEAFLYEYISLCGRMAEEMLKMF